MNKNIRKHIDDLASTDDKVRLEALQNLLRTTESRVDWVYEVWDHLLEKLDHENSYQRSIGIMMLCNLAKSDSENRLESALDRLLVHTRDEKFITSRQCIQSIWKAAATNTSNRAKILNHLEKRFVECADEKHFNLLRQDMIQSMISLHHHEEDHGLLTRIQALIAKEQDIKNRRKYEALLKAKCWGSTERIGCISMKMAAKIPVDMIAPCGINCAACYAHLRVKRTCPGCRGQEDSQPLYCRKCRIRDCALSRGIDFCSACPSFPCPPVRHIDKRYRLRYHVSLIENGIRIQTVGARQFLLEEKQKWTCPQCGGVICLHDRACSDCGMEMEPAV